VKPHKPAWPVVLVLLAIIGLSGCRAAPPPAPPPTAVASAEELLARLQTRDRSSQSFQARGRITFLSPQRNYSGTIMLKAQRPTGLRVDVIDLLGRTVLSFATDGTRVQVLSPGEGKFFQGPASPGNLAAFIPPAVTLPQALRLLVGSLPLSPGPPAKFDYDAASAQYVLEWRQGEALQERLRVAAQGLYPVKDEYFGGAAQPRFTVELADFGEAAVDFPGKLTLKTETPKMELRLAYKELRLNPAMTPADLTLAPPPGMAVVNLP
jgi:hypothetical protein